MRFIKEKRRIQDILFIIENIFHLKQCKKHGILLKSPELLGGLIVARNVLIVLNEIKTKAIKKDKVVHLIPVDKKHQDMLR